MQALTGIGGIGGIGKTQLAIEYAHLFAADYDLVGWIDAAVPDLIGDQLARLAVTAGGQPPAARSPRPGNRSPPGSARPTGGCSCSTGSSILRTFAVTEDADRLAGALGDLPLALVPGRLRAGVGHVRRRVLRPSRELHAVQPLPLIRLSASLSAAITTAVDVVRATDPAADDLLHILSVLAA